MNKSQLKMAKNNLMLKKLNNVCVCMMEEKPVKVDFEDYPYSIIHGMGLVKKITIYSIAENRSGNPYYQNIELDIDIIGDRSNLSLPISAITFEGVGEIKVNIKGISSYSIEDIGYVKEVTTDGYRIV